MLKDIVVVVSLVHTLTESFGSAKDLFLKLKRTSKKADSSDEEDGDRKHRHRLSRRHRDSSSDSESGKGRHHHLRWKRRPEEDPFTDSDEELIVTSSSRVRAEYDRGYNKLGEPFARGDCMYLISRNITPHADKHSNGSDPAPITDHRVTADSPTNSPGLYDEHVSIAFELAFTSHTSYSDDTRSSRGIHLRSAYAI